MPKNYKDQKTFKLHIDLEVNFDPTATTPEVVAQMYSQAIVRASEVDFSLEDISIKVGSVQDIEINLY